MEHTFIGWFFENKEIVNPVDPDEVFTCKDLVEDYKICRKEKRLQTGALGQRMNCSDYRQLGKCSNDGLCNGLINLTLLSSYFFSKSMLLLR